MARDNNFDIVRLLLAYLVLVSHSYIMLSSVDPINWLTHGQIEGGALAVNFFFALSGYLISLSWFQSLGMLDFLWKRVLRIYPGYVVAVTACVTVVGMLAAEDKGAYWRELSLTGAFKNALVLGGVLAPRVFSDHLFPYMNISLWTIPYEFGCYLLVALLGTVGLLKRSPARIWALLFSLTYLVTILVHFKILRDQGPLTESLVRFILYFSAGAGLSSRPPSFWRRKGYLSCMLFTALLSTQLGLMSLVFPIAGTVCLLYLCLSEFSKITLPRPPVDISYGLYLYAFPIQQLWVAAGITSPLALTLLSTCSVVAPAYLSYRAVEKPFLALKSLGRAAKPRNLRQPPA